MYMKHISGIIALLLILTILAVPAAATDTGSLVIVHTNDAHGRFHENIGYAGTAAIIDSLRNNHSSVIILDAGDALHGTPEAIRYNGSSVVEIMNAIGYTAMTAGNHDFDYGLDELINRSNEMKFPLLAANIFYKNTTTPVFQEHMIVKRGDYTIGIFGLATPKTMTTTTNAENLNVTFSEGDELYTVAGKQVAALKAEGCNLIICISHLGTNDWDEPDRSIDVAKNVDGIDIIVDGHSHTALTNGELINNTLIVSTGSYLKAVGVVTVSPGKNITAALITESPATNTTIEHIVNKYINQTREAYHEVAGHSEFVLDGSRKPGVRDTETNLGDFYADALRAVAEKEGYTPDAAIINGGGIRTTIEAGNITRYDLVLVAPFNNLLAVINVKGSVILQALEENTGSCPNESGGFPQVSGITYTIDTTKPFISGEVHRVSISSINDKPFDPEKMYSIATVDFLASGGDAYFPFAKYYTGNTTGIIGSDVLYIYLNDILGGAIGSEYAKPAGRITILTSPAPAATPVGVTSVLAGLACAALFLRRR